MGNSPSSSRPNLNSISKPYRPRSAQGSPDQGFLTTSNLGSHRRTRSANSAIRRNLDPDLVHNPPPPYSRTPPAYYYSDEPEQMKYIYDSQSSFSSSSTEGSSKHRMRSSYLRTPMRQQTIDDMLETLRKYDTVIIVDDSSSMIGARWAEAASALSALADLAGQFDADGIDIHFLNDDRVGKNMTREAVEDLFNQIRPRGVTPIGERLEDLLRDYLEKLEAAYDSGNLKSIKPVNFVVLTDGAPTDDPESVIVQAARRLDAKHFPLSQVGIQFVQIGKSAGAARYLRELDDNLVSQYHIRDIVDTTKYIGKDLSADALVKILLGGINRRVDNKGVEVFNEDAMKGPILRLEGPY